MSTSELVSGNNSTETPTIAPWRDFFDIRSLSIPSSLLDATTRLIQNISHFRGNYINIILNICYLYIGFFVRPLALSLFPLYVGTTLACCFAYAKCSCSLLHRRILLGLVAVFTVFMFALAQAWLHLLVVLVTSTAFVCLHGVLGVPTFEYDELLDPPI